MSGQERDEGCFSGFQGAGEAEDVIETPAEYL